jgi:hypothetical protein
MYVWLQLARVSVYAITKLGLGMNPSGWGLSWGTVSIWGIGAFRGLRSRPSDNMGYSPNMLLWSLFNVISTPGARYGPTDAFTRSEAPKGKKEEGDGRLLHYTTPKSGWRQLYWVTKIEVTNKVGEELSELKKWAKVKVTEEVGESKSRHNLGEY